MTTLTELQAQLDELKNARASGARIVTYGAGSAGQRSVEFKSDADMAKAIAWLTDEIQAAQGVTRPKRITIRSSKGW